MFCFYDDPPETQENEPLIFMIIDIVFACLGIVIGLALLIGFPLFLLWLLW